MADDRVLGYDGLARILNNFANTYTKTGHSHTAEEIANFPYIPKFTSDLINDEGYVKTDFNTTYELMKDADGSIVLRGSDGTATKVKIEAISTGGSGNSGDILAHNVDETAHEDIRRLILDVAERLNTLANSDDETLDQMGEVVEYIKTNKELIEAITTAKIDVDDIADNLVTNSNTQPLSAAQGVVLKGMIDRLGTLIGGSSVGEQVNKIISELPSISNDAIDEICQGVIEEAVDETDIDELMKKLK